MPVDDLPAMLHHQLPEIVDPTYMFGFAPMPTAG
jgi:hypothetical protein